MQLSCFYSKHIKQLSFSSFVFIFLLTSISFVKPLKAFAVPVAPACQQITNTINQSIIQVDPAGSTPIKFKVVFSSPITASTFLPSQIELTGTAPSKSVTGITEIAPNDGTTFEVGVATTGNGTVIANVKDASYTSSVLGTTGSNPVGITIDQSGNIYTANATSNNVSKITPAGVSSIFGTTGNAPYYLTIDQDGNIFTADYFSYSSVDNLASISKITPAGVTSIYATMTTGNPNVITRDQTGNIYVTNGGPDKVTKITPTGVSSVLGDTGRGPNGIVLDQVGNVYTSNFFSSNVTKITPSGVSSIFGTTGNNPNQTSGPSGLVIDQVGNLYTANYYSNTVTKITPSGVSSIFGTTGNNPNGIAIDSAGNIYTANATSNNVSKITPTGISSIIGTTGNIPQNIILDPAGNVYISNRLSNNVTKLTKTGASLVSGCTISNQLATNFALPSTSIDNTVTVDTTPPPATGTPDLATSSDSGTSNTDDITNDTTPSFDIPCQAGSIVTIYNSSNPLATKLCPVENKVSITLATPLTNGTYSITAKQINQLGVLSEISNIINIIVVSSAPVPIIDELEATSNQTPTVTGKCEDGSGLTVTFNPTNEILNTICDRLNKFTIIPTIRIPFGPYTVSVTQNDLLGNITQSGLSNGIVLPPEPTLDTDNDGVPDIIEASGPNNGDFNNDGIPDLSQYFIRGMKGTNNQFVGLITNYVFGSSSSSCGGGTVAVGAASYSTPTNKKTNKQDIPATKQSTNILDGISESTLSTQDTTYSYPKGLIKYTTNCLEPGSTIPIELYFSNQTDSPNLKVRKYKNGTYSDLPEATKTQITLGGLPTVKVTYNITDGGELDEDGLANGEIVDPIGLALLEVPTSGVTSNTGDNETITTLTPINNTTTPVLIRTGGVD
jgi:sugar lactone lactonase YvrE